MESLSLERENVIKIDFQVRFIFFFFHNKQISTKIIKSFFSVSVGISNICKWHTLSHMTRTRMKDHPPLTKTCFDRLFRNSTECKQDNVSKQQNVLTVLIFHSNDFFFRVKVISEDDIPVQ